MAPPSFAGLLAGCSSLLLPLLLLGSGTTAAPAPVPAAAAFVEALSAAANDSHWVDTWTSMPQLVEQSNMPPASFSGGGATFRDATLRQTLHMSIGAPRIRVQISNTFGGSDLPITSASLALPAGGKVGSNAIEPATLAALTFDGGKPGVTVPRGQMAYSDPIDYAVEPQSMLTVTLYLATGQPGNSITGHPGSRTTSWMQSGNHLNATTVTGGSTKHWYYVNAVEAWAPANTSALIILGDSITDGRGSTDDANNRWPDLVLAKLQKAGVTNLGVNNEAAGGNTVLSGGLGPPLMSRYKRDALQQQGVKYVLIFEGVNDIGANAGADALINAFKTIIADCKKAGLKVFGATITPFGGNSYSSGGHEAVRKRVNDWILTGGAYDGTVDFAKLLADPSNPERLASKYDSGDHLHPSVAGYQYLADNFPTDLFK
ncbi:Esterase, SGNH hydrolase-type, subgroup [Niveomyces insectorum RCEF 264]|uniref:Esterase, SGNH hydrolase-type, subgroup n=1 Tax=Niveomyces insectorum RCEF 264 TaxID=1081102 RepID=A0A167XWM8_9HYPO|nr:Esterase, SGNH hydrolase-type, subgroup [Niveomyces insectorum RCEF 264]